jgi:PIN domain nuclease of toxin-antitoxin system
VLLDTHVFLWLHTEPERLGERLGVVEDPRTELLVSAASSWEIAIKYAAGRLPLPEPPERYVPSRILALGARGLPVEHSHALAVAGLPALHRDPFDRLLVAQSANLDVPILTADPAIAEYPVRVLAVDRAQGAALGTQARP